MIESTRALIVINHSTMRIVFLLLKILKTPGPVIPTSTINEIAFIPVSGANAVAGNHLM